MRRHEQVAMKYALIFLAVLIALVLGGYFSWNYLQQQWYVGQVPAQIGISGVRYMQVQEGPREGCGAVVFKLSPEMQQALQIHGLKALEQATQARDHQGRDFAYAPWQVTPYVETGEGMTLKDRWLTGLGCAHFPPDLSQLVEQALRTPGAYVSTTAEGGLILIPAQALAVLAFQG
jgi:hypothetical protein